MDEAEIKINDHWRKASAILDGTAARMNKLQGNMHLTLEEVLRKVTEAMNSLKKEKEKFLKIQQIYEAGDIPSHLAEQQIKLAELLKKKTDAQIKLTGLQKEFKEQAAFCLVSFREYDETVCDITNRVS